MRIATWNVNSLRARLDFVLLWLRERQPDVACLQELKLTDDMFPHEAFEAEGWRACTHGQKAWNGVCVLSREPVETSQTGLPGQEEMGARLMTASTSGISFTSVYVPNGKTVDHPDFPRKLTWLDALRSHLESTLLPQQLAVVCGDFNLCPTALDSWNEERFRGSIFHTDEERGRYRALEKLGLTDAYRAKNPEGQAFSWWDYRGGAFHRGLGLRIDLILMTEPLLKRVQSVETDRDWRKKHDGLVPSDHAPVICELADV